MEWKESGQVRIAIGSKNPVKVNSSINGVAKALQPLLCKEVKVQVHGKGFNVPSDVSDQPMSEAETKTGACNRARNAWNAFMSEVGNAPDFAVGLEGGIVNDESEMICSAWMAVYNGTTMGTARTCSFPLPPSIRRLVLGGMELGDADDQIFGSVNSKQAGGTVGHLSRGVIDRTAYYEPAVVLAMVPLLWPDLYK